ncbi:MAG: hypothetical protein ACK5X3_03885 [Pseudomonadota bacterium]|jgi:hypothetical protein
MNLIPFRKETNQQFYERLVYEVDAYILDRYGIDWRTAAKQWGETDDQGIYNQFYYMTLKLRYFISRSAKEAS